MKFIRYGFVLVTFLFVVAFAAKNNSSIDVNYLFGAAKLPLVLILFIALLIGVLISALLMGVKILKLKHQNHRLQKEVQKIPKEPT